MLNKIVFAFVTLLSLLLVRNLLAQTNISYHEQYLKSKKTYNTILDSWNDGAAYKNSDNLAGHIVWGESYVMESLLEMYLATMEKLYLLKFIEHADAVNNNRDDIIGNLDWQDQIDFGWLTDGHFTLGIPITISDTRGKPSIELQAIRYGNNNNTYFSVKHKRESNSFSIKVWNDKIKKVQNFNNLTMDNVEDIVNKSITPSSMLKIRRTGNSRPKEVEKRRFKTHKTRLISIHSPIICSPFARFSYLIEKYNLSEFNVKAKEYLNIAEECAASYLRFWVEDDVRGYFIVKKNNAFWMSGLPVPHNILSANGILYLYLYLNTNNNEYQDKIIKISNTLKRGFSGSPTSEIKFHYAYGRLFSGWKDRNMSLYPNFLGSKHVEDNMHFSFTLRFIIESHQLLGLFDRVYIDNLLHIFKTSYRRDNISYYTDGSGGTQNANQSAGTYVLLGTFEHHIFDQCSFIYQRDYRNLEAGYVLLGWARMTRMAILLSNEGFE